MSETLSSDERRSAQTQKERICWETSISLLKNPLVIKQTALVVVSAGLFMALLLSFILALTGEFSGIPTMLLISFLAAAGLGAFMVLIMLVFFGGRFWVRFTVDEQGTLWESVDRRAKAANRLGMLAAVLGRSPQAAAASGLAAAREKEFVSWKEVSAMEQNRRQLMITLRNSWRPVMMLVCLPENYDRVLEYVAHRIVPKPAAPGARAKPLGKAILRTALVALAVAPLFTLSSYPLELDILLPLIMFMFALATVWLVPLFGWVVIGCAVVLAVLVTVAGVSEFAYLYRAEQVAFLLSYVGLAYLLWFSWGSVRGKIRSLLMEE
jgi:hypothetical protein